DEEIADLGLLERITLQVSQVFIDNPEAANARVIKSISIMMFFLLPVFGVILKLMYFRKRKFYIEHLIFSIHLHAFLFLLLTFSLLGNIQFPEITAILVFGL